MPALFINATRKVTCLLGFACAGLGSWPDVQYAHHLVIFMGEDMTVPDVAPRLIKVSPDAGALFGQNGHHVFGSTFIVSISRAQSDGTAD